MPLPSYINLDPDLLCRTTGWENNCGLNCLTHFLAHQLNTGALERTFSKNHEYEALLKTFQEYYDLPKTPTWREIKHLLDAYPVPSDKEAIFSPALRVHLGKILAKKAEATWETDATAAISEYLRTGEIRDAASPVYHANAEWFEALKAHYDTEERKIMDQNITPEEEAKAIHDLSFRENPIEATPSAIRVQVEFYRRNSLLAAHLEAAKKEWISEGAMRYGVHMADSAEMVSAGQLALLSEALSIGLEVYTPTSIEDSIKRPSVGKTTQGRFIAPDKNFPLTLKVYNSGLHWEFEEPTRNPEVVDAHNDFYPTVFDKEQVFQGEFQLFGNQASEETSEIIQASVQNLLIHKRKRASVEPILPQFNGGQFKRLELSAHQAMDSLVTFLAEEHKQGHINDQQQKHLFEFYFNQFEQELKKGPSGLSTPSMIPTLVKKIQEKDLVTLKETAQLSEGIKSKKPRNE